MKRFIAILVGVVTLCTALVMPAQAVQTGNEWGVSHVSTAITVPAAVSTPAVVQARTGPTGWKLGIGAYPAKICVANGYGPTAVGLIEDWNTPGYALDISVQNRCDGYSATNRMTIDSFSPVGGACFAMTNTHKKFDPVQGKDIFDQNVVLWINVWGGCWSNSSQLYHRIEMYMGHVLGLNLNSTGCTCVMGTDSYSLNYVPYVTHADDEDMATYVYNR